MATDRLTIVHLPTWELIISTWDLQWGPDVTKTFAHELEKVIRERKFDVTDCDIQLHNMLLEHKNIRDVLYLKAHVEGRGDWRFIVEFLKMTWKVLQILQAPKITLRKIRYEVNDTSIGALIKDCGKVNVVDIFGEENEKLEK